MSPDEAGPPDPAATGRPDRRAGDLRPWAVGIAAAVAAVVAVAADAAPTGIPAWDAVLRAATAALFTVALARGTPTARIVAVALVAVASSGAPQLAAAAGLVIAVGSVALRRDPLPVRLATGVLAAPALYAMGPFLFFGAPTLVGVGAVAIAIVGASRSLDAATAVRARRWVRLGAAFAASWFLVVLAGFLTVQDDARAGATAARRGLDAAREGEQDLAVGYLARAEERFDRTADRLGSWWMAPGRLVPVLGQHLDAGHDLARAGATIGGAARAAALGADVDELRADEGRVDVDRLAGMAPLLADLLAAIDSGVATIDTIDGPWLVPQLPDRAKDLRRELLEARPDTVLALDAARVVPDLLGADTPRRYLAVFATPAESRELGGIVSNFIELEVWQGRLEITRQGRNLDLNDRSRGAELADPDRYPDRYLTYRPWRFAQNYTAMPDLPLVTQAIADLYPQMGGAPIDGVVYLDPFAIRAMLEITGPLRIPALDGRLSAEEVVDFLLLGQYQTFPEVDERTDLLEDVATVAFDRILGSRLPGPERLGRIFGPVARGGHLAVSTFDDDANAFLERVHLRQPFPRADGRDLVTVAQSNGSPSKLDQFVTRTVHYDATVDATGAVSGTVEVALTSDAPAEGLPEYVLGRTVDDDTPGTDTLFVSLYVPHEVRDPTADGEPLTLEQADEFGVRRWGIFVPVEPGATRVLRFPVHGRVDLTDGTYRLVLPQQALLEPDQLTATIRFTGGPRVVSTRVVDRRGEPRAVQDLHHDDRSVSLELALVEDVELVVDLDP